MLRSWKKQTKIKDQICLLVAALKQHKVMLTHKRTSYDLKSTNALNTCNKINLLPSAKWGNCSHSHVRVVSTSYLTLVKKVNKSIFQNLQFALLLTFILNSDRCFICEAIQIKNIIWWRMDVHFKMHPGKCCCWSTQWLIRVTVRLWTLWWVKNGHSSWVAAHSYKNKDG